MNFNPSDTTRPRLLLLLTILIGTALHGEAFADDEGFQAEMFKQGRHEISLGNGFLVSPCLPAANRPKVDYSLTELQIGYMLSEVAGPGVCRGNWEVAGSGFGGAVLKGTGSYVFGITVWLRYNLVPRRSRFAPYLQGGVGLADTDIDRRLVGQDFNFNLDLAGGTRFLITSRWSINLEYRYQHISNATLAHRDLGLNAHGPVLAVSCFF